MRHLQQTHRRAADADGARANLSQDRVEGCYSALSSLTVVLSASLQIVRVRFSTHATPGGATAVDH